MFRFLFVFLLHFFLRVHKVSVYKFVIHSKIKVYQNTKTKDKQTNKQKKQVLASACVHDLLDVDLRFWATSKLKIIMKS